jgi:hypothetical protein
VNINPGGRVHEQTCKWLIGSLNGNGNASSYRNIRADQVPASKPHCSHC